MPAEGRPITRPRQSFSCVVCRRRKVRCGREQPACSNCVRIRETCEYEADILSKPAAHPDPKPTASPFHANARKINTSTQGTQHAWPQWTLQGPDAVLADHGEYAGIGTDTGDQSAQFPNNSCSSPASSSSLHGGGSSRNSSTRISIQTLPSSTGDPIFTPPPPQGTYYQPENNSHWRTPVSDGQGQLGRLSSTTAPSQTTQHVTQHNIHDLSRKRPRSSGYTEQSDGALEEARGEPDTFFDGERNACAFTGEGERANHRVHGYLSVRNGGQTRYVSEAFWASLKGHVSSTLSRCCLQPILAHI